MKYFAHACQRAVSRACYGTEKRYSVSDRDTVYGCLGVFIIVNSFQQFVC